MVEVHPGDRRIDIRMTLKSHRAEVDEKAQYPNPDLVINDIINGRYIERLVIAGFHMWDCVDRLARRAWERGLPVLVDEDLTEFLGFRIKSGGINTAEYPGWDPKKAFREESFFEEFQKARKNKPWLYQFI